MVSWVGIFGCTVMTFLVGGLWYSPLLFGKAWARAADLSDEALARDLPRVFGGSFVLGGIICTNLAFFIGPDAGVAFGAAAGAAAGAGWVSASLGVVALFERRPLALFLINAGYNTVTYTLAGALLAAAQGAGLP